MWYDSAGTVSGGGVGGGEFLGGALTIHSLHTHEQRAQTWTHVETDRLSFPVVSRTPWQLVISRAVLQLLKTLPVLWRASQFLISDK